MTGAQIVAVYIIYYTSIHKTKKNKYYNNIYEFCINKQTK